MAKKTSRQSAIEIQISARFQKPKNGRPISKELVREAIQYKIDHGTDPTGITLRIVRWRHPGKRWSTSQDEAREWQRFGRLLHYAQVDVFTSRSH